MVNFYNSATDLIEQEIKVLATTWSLLCHLNSIIFLKQAFVYHDSLCTCFGW